MIPAPCFTFGDEPRGQNEAYNDYDDQSATALPKREGFVAAPIR
jgi:hypothetical protein